MALYYRFQLEGFFPERGLLRLKRAGIALYQVQKTQKNTLLFLIKKKDREKVFAIYPKVCYNREEKVPYRLTELGGVGLAKGLDFCKNRVGLLLGGLAFCALTLFADNLVFGVEFVGSTVYTRETVQALYEAGIKPFSLYPAGKEDVVTAKLLSLRGVEFCSVQKVGGRVRVEVRKSALASNSLQMQPMISRREGELVEFTVLRGTPLKKKGEHVLVGETLVGDWFEGKDGGQVRVEPIARARIACVYEGVHAVDSEEQAFAEGYLALCLAEGDTVSEKRIERRAEGFHVKISYLVTQTINL